MGSEFRDNRRRQLWQLKGSREHTGESALVRFHTPKWNVGQGIIHLTGPTLGASIILASELADRGASNLVVGLAFPGPLLLALILLWRRYIPMYGEIDLGADMVRYRNAWGSGSFQLSRVEAFEPRSVWVGHLAVRALLSDGSSRPTVRAARYEDFVSSLRGLTNEEGRPGHNE